MSLSASPALAAPPPSDKPTDLVEVSKELITDTYYDEELGLNITSTGIETTYVEKSLASKSGQSDSQVALLAAGCTVTKYMGTSVGSSRSSVAPYTLYATGTAYVDTSSGCPYSHSVTVNLRQDWGVWQPTVDTASANAQPGQRRYATVADVCEPNVNYYLTGSASPSYTPNRKVC